MPAYHQEGSLSFLKIAMASVLLQPPNHVPIREFFSKNEKIDFFAAKNTKYYFCYKELIT